jgi:hypothetical protein
MPSPRSEGGLTHFAALRSTGWAAAVRLVAGTALIVGLLRYQERFVSVVTTGCLDQGQLANAGGEPPQPLPRRPAGPAASA